MMSIMHRRASDVFMRNDFIFNLSGLGRRQVKMLNILHNFSNKVIETRRQILTDNTNCSKGLGKDENNIGERRKLALLDVLLQSTIDGKPLTNEDIKDEVNTFKFGSHGTSTSAIAFLLYNIAKHSDVQQKLFDEVRDAFGNDLTKPMGIEDLNSLSYLDLVIKESMRLFSPIPLFARNIKANVNISKHVNKIILEF